MRRKGGTNLVQGEVAKFPDFPIGKLTTKYITVKCARGHNFRSCELALKQLASDRFPLVLITTHRMGLKDADKAIKSVGAAQEVIHVSLLPWE
jgi:threonine dehydrogenase-like Zn-dependent dehydrogenase